MIRIKLRRGRELAARTFSTCLLVLLSVALAWPQLANLDRDLVPDAVVEPAWFRGSFRTYDIAKEARPGPLPRVYRVSYPKAWLKPDGSSSPPLATFIDGRRATWLHEEPFFETLGEERVYAYLREAASQSLFVVCPENSQCSRVDLIRDDVGARIALARTFPGVVGRALAWLGVGFGLAVFLTWLALNRLSPVYLAFLVVAEGANLLVADADPEVRGGRAIALVLIGIAIAPALSLLRRTLEWVQRVIDQPSAASPVAKGLIFAVCAGLSSWPGWRTAIGWYPGAGHDSQFYVFAASRFLRSGDLLQAILEPENWRYSAYPMFLAVFSRVTGLHPMDAYDWVSVVGAIAMTAASGATAWIATSRFSTALVATWISGTWGGLGGWAWLFGAGRSLLLNVPLAPFNDDYYEKRFFGEFTGPYSELTTYLTSAPFYPREAGLVPFWIGVGLLYRRLRPGPRPPSLLGIGALFLLSTAVYPYYGLAAVLALSVTAYSEGRGGEAMRRQRNRTILACVGIAIPVLVIADVTSRAYRGYSAWAWASQFLEAAPVALAANNYKPSLDFLIPRILSGEFFFAIAFVGALGLGMRPNNSLFEPQRRAAVTSLCLCVAHGLLSQSSDYLHLLSFNFRWFVSWRSLLTPILVLVAALFVEELVGRAALGRRLRLATLLLLPSVSGIVWSEGVTDYVNRERARGQGRGVIAPLWSEYRAHGRALLGRVMISDPLLIEASVPGEGAVAAAAFGVHVFETAELGVPSATGDPGLPGSVESAALRRGSPLSARVIPSECCSLIGSFGTYDIYARIRKPLPADSTR